jgi:hypothetical protein
VYLRRNRRTVDGQTYESWTLVESVRTTRGPRQHTVANLGKLPGLDAGVQQGWENIDALLDGREAPQQLPLPGVGPATAAPCWREVDVRGARVERVREFGAVYVALALWRRLGLHTVLRELLAAGREEVPWEAVACVLTIARFCAQASELGVAEHWFQRTVLDDLLGVDWRRESTTTGSTAVWMRSTPTKKNSPPICWPATRAGLACASSFCSTTSPAPSSKARPGRTRSPPAATRATTGPIARRCASDWS